MNLDPHTVAKALGGEARGNNVSAPSPGHNARDRGLSVTIDPGAPDGFLVNAFNETDGVAMKDYVRGRLGLPAWEPEKKTTFKPKPTKVCHYDYYDKDNEPYLRVVRMSDKSFRQMHWEIDGWENKKPDGPAIPYRLPEILANPEREIWLVEGEKDADRLAGLGLIATTAPGGGANHIADIAPWLDGQKVIALPDNDATGRTWSDKVKSLLPDAQIVNLPDLPFKGDVSDWLDKGRSLDDLLEAVANPVTTVSDVSLHPAIITPTPFEWIDPNLIPPREWLYDTHLIRKFVSLTVSPGGLGKSSLALIEALSLAIGRPLFADATVHEPDPLRVWYWNGEDPQNETQRRVVAACVHYGLKPTDFAGRLFTDTGREQALTLGQIVRGEIALDEDLFVAIEEQMLAARIDVLILDPFVSAHRLGENDNNAIDAVIKRLGKLADRTNAAVEIVHHVRKPSGGNTAATDVNDARGASALLGGVRSARVLNVMSEEIAEAAAVPRDLRHRYFSITEGKANMSAKAADASWRFLESVALGNQTDTRKTDNVGVVTYFKLPEAARVTEDLSQAEDEMRLILSTDDTVAHWSGRGQKPKNWLGHRILEALKIHDGDHDRALARLINGWIKEGKVVIRSAWIDRNRKIFLTLPGASFEASPKPENEEDSPF